MLKPVQARLAVHPLTAPILGNNHSEFHSRAYRVRKSFCYLILDVVSSSNPSIVFKLDCPSYCLSPGPKAFCFRSFDLK